MNTHYLTLNQAAKETKKSPSTIHKALKSGKLSYVSKDDSGYKIDPSELFRVFPKNTFEKILVEQSRIAENTEEKSDYLLEFELLKRDLEHEKEKSRSLSEQLKKAEEREEISRKSNEKLTDTLSKQTLMIEDMRHNAPQKPVERRKGVFGRLLR